MLAKLIILITSITTFITNVHSRSNIFREDLVIFTSNYNITKILVPAEGMSYIQKDFSDIPIIFFTVSDQYLDGGSCIYVLEGLAAYEILDGGRDSTCDYGSDKSIYFGAKDGVYKYNSESLSAKRYSPFRDDIIQIQKANGTDTIYYLTAEKKIYKLQNKGKSKREVYAITCALEFVLDNSNNIYYVDCRDGFLKIVKTDETAVKYKSIKRFKKIKLIRPAFIMEKCVPFFGDSHLYFLYANGTSERKGFYVTDEAAYSIDAGLYLAAALNGKIYEFNVMKFFLKYMYGSKSNRSNDLVNVVLSIVESFSVDMFKDNRSLIIRP